MCVLEGEYNAISPSYQNLVKASLPRPQSTLRLVWSARSAAWLPLSRFAVRHLEKEALSNQARSGRIEEDAWGRG